MKALYVNSLLQSRFLLIVGVIISVVYYILPIGEFSNTLFDFGFLFVWICVLLFFFSTRNSSLKGFWFKPSNLFLIAYLAVNFQYIFDFRLGLKNSFSMSILHTEVLNHCFVLGCVGLVAFISGYIGTSDKTKDLTPAKETSSNPLETIKFPLVLLHFLSFIAFVYLIDLDTFLTGEIYGESDASFTHIEKLLNVLNVLTVLYAIKKTLPETSLRAYIRSFPLFSIIIIFSYIMLRLVSGDRGPFLYTLLLLFYGYAFVSRKKYRLGRTVLILFVGAVVMSVVGIARKMDLNESFLSRFSTASEAFADRGRFVQERSVSPLTDELGLSFLVNQTDVYAIEVEGEHLHPGSYLAISVLNGIPFVPSLLMKSFHLDYEDFSSTGFANVHYFEGIERTSSIGTTIVGDFYLQFSVFGVLLGLFITGILMKKIDLYIYSKDRESLNIYLLLFALIFASRCIYIPRSLLLGEVSTLILSIIVLLLLRLVSR